MSTIQELLAAEVPAELDTTSGASMANLLGGTPDTQEVTTGREQSQTAAVAESVGETEAKIKEWSGGKVVDPTDPAAVRKAEVLRQMAERTALNKKVEQNLPETLSFAGLDTGVPLNKSVSAGLVGMGDMMMDTVNGIQQIIGVNEEKLAQEQASVNELYASSRGGAATAGAVVGAIAEPLGIVLPAAKSAKLWQLALASTTVGGIFGVTGYVDKDAGQTRLGNTAIGVAGGLMVSPIAHGLNKAANAASNRAFAKAGNTMIDNFELQTKKFQTAGANQQLALRAAKKKLGYTDESIAAAINAADRKVKIVTKTNARQQINAIEDFEAAMSTAPTSRLGKSVENLITPINTRLQRISRPIFHRLKEHDLGVQIRETRHFKKVDPFLKDLDNFKGEASTTMQKALMTGDFDTVHTMLKATGDKRMLANFGQARHVLKEIYKDLRDVGYDIPKIDNYFPRIVKDVKEVSRIQHDQVSNALRQARQAKGGELTTLEIANAMDSLIVRTGNRTFAHTAGSLKKRSKHVINDELLPHYQDPARSLHSYIRSTSADIERRKLFADFGYKKELSRTGGDLDASIGTLVASGRARGMTKDQQNEVVELLKARFGPGEKAASQSIQAIKNAIYTVTLGNPISAATQFGDVVFSAKRHGIARTISSMFGTKVAKKELLGLTDAIEEFVSTRDFSKKALDWSLTWGGFKRVDRLGKETLMNAALSKYNSWSKTAKGQQKFVKEWSKYFGKETPQLMDDLANKKLTDNVKLLLWHELSGVQPISLSEMPLKYLQHPDGRILYMLRTFTIKQLDFMRREILHEATKGNHLKAAKGLAMFAGLFIMGNSTVDAMKDFMQGKEIDMEDHFVDNAWTLLGVNKYTVDSVTRQGPGRALVDFLAPPLTVFDDLYRARNDPKKLWNLLPPYGKLIGAWQSTERDDYLQSLDLGKFEPTDIKSLLKK